MELKQSLQVEDEFIATTLNNLAENYRKQKLYPEAEVRFREALELKPHLLEKDKLLVAKICSNLALVCQSQKNYQEAESLHQEALELKKSLWGHEHCTVARGVVIVAAFFCTPVPIATLPAIATLVSKKLRRLSKFFCCSKIRTFFAKIEH